MEIALFKNLEFDYVSIHERSNDLYMRDGKYIVDGYVQLTEWIDVDFAYLPSAINQEIEALDKAISRRMAGVAEIEKRKAEILKNAEIEEIEIEAVT